MPKHDTNMDNTESVDSNIEEQFNSAIDLDSNDIGTAESAKKLSESTKSTDDGHWDDDDDTESTDKPSEKKVKSNEEDDDWEDDDDIDDDSVEDTGNRKKTEDNEDPKAKVPSYRLRELREKHDREIKERDEKVRIAEEKAQKAIEELTVTKTQVRGLDPNNLQAVYTHVRTNDDIAKDLTGKIDYVTELGTKGGDANIAKLKELGITTHEQWVAVLTELTSAREARVNQEVSNLQTEHKNKIAASQKEQHDYQQNLATDYDSAIESSKIPGIKKYVERVAHNAHRLNVDIRQIILHADNVDQVTAAIGSSKKLFNELAKYPVDKKLDRGTLVKIAAKVGRSAERFALNVHDTIESVVDEDERPARSNRTAIKRNTSVSKSKYKTTRDGVILLGGDDED